MAAVKASVRLSFALKDPERTSACSGLQINMPPICDSPLMCVCVRLRVCACMCVGVPASTPWIMTKAAADLMENAWAQRGLAHARRKLEKKKEISYSILMWAAAAAHP